MDETFDQAEQPKTLPSNVEAEAALLGALLIDNSQFDYVADRLRAEDFFATIHQRIYASALSQFNQSGFCNPVTLAPFFKEDPELKELGGITYLARLTSDGQGLLGVRDLTLQLADMGKRRRIIAGLESARTAALDVNLPIADAIGLADDAIAEKSQDAVKISSAADCFDEMLAGYEREDRGVTCKIIPSLDHVMGHLLPSQLIIGAGRPGMGKTAVWLSYARGAAMKGHGVIYVSLEMRGRELAQRIAADHCYDESPIPYELIRDGRLDRGQMEQIRRGRDRMRELPLDIVDTGSLTTGRLASIVRRKKRKWAAQGQSLDLVIIDYLQLLRTDVRLQSRFETVTEISQALKALAKDMEVPVVALAQLSREVEKRPDKRPMLSDLRESGQIEQDADLVLFLLREEYYLQKEKPQQGGPKFDEWQMAIAEVRDQIQFIVAKRRNGVEGTTTGRFFGEYQAVRG